MDRQEDLERQVRDAAKEMDRDADEMESRGDEVGDDVERARAEWERRRRDPGVPGADAGTDSDGGEAA